MSKIRSRRWNRILEYPSEGTYYVRQKKLLQFYYYSIIITIYSIITNSNNSYFKWVNRNKEEFKVKITINILRKQDFIIALK